MTSTHSIFLIPGMFGFARLAGYDYFTHVEQALKERFSTAGVPCEIVQVASPPTGSIRRRAEVLAEAIMDTCADTSGPVYLLGHSTGGLDARLLACPSTKLRHDIEPTSGIERIRSVVTFNTPHYGTPIAYFFSTVSGTRLLHALSLLTFVTLRLGELPLSALSTFVEVAGRLDDVLRFDVGALDRSTDAILQLIGESSRQEVLQWLRGIRKDQGGVIQLAPECMDIFNAAVEDSDKVRYGCVVSAGPRPSAMHWAATVRSPYQALSATLYSTLHALAGRSREIYAVPPPAKAVQERLDIALHGQVTRHSNDGVVPTESMLWGKLLWAGDADHLDILGHFHDPAPPHHTDWLKSGADFTRERFDELMDAVASHFLESDESEGDRVFG